MAFADAIGSPAAGRRQGRCTAGPGAYNGGRSVHPPTWISWPSDASAAKEEKEGRAGAAATAGPPRRGRSPLRASVLLPVIAHAQAG